MSRSRRWMLPIATGTVLVAIWYLLRRTTHLESYVLPAPDEVFAAAWRERSALVAAACTTAGGAVLGFIAAVALGFALSTVLAWSAPIKQSLYPYVLILHMTPVIILAPIFVLWLGQGLPSIVAITFMICFFPVVANTTMGFMSVDQNLRDLFVMSGATRSQEIRYLRIPGAMPYFLTGMKIAGTLAPIGAITGDFLAGSAQNGVGGLGFMTIMYFSQLKTPALFATGMIACAMGFVFVGVVNYVHWLILRSWHDSMVKRE